MLLVLTPTAGGGTAGTALLSFPGMQGSLGSDSADVQGGNWDPSSQFPPSPLLP